MKYFSLLLFLLLVSLNCSADVYTEVDENGATVYSDKPMSDNAKRLTKTEINQSSTVESVAPTPETTTSTVIVEKNVEVKKQYTTFTMLSPIDQESIQNQATINISMKVEPTLQTGDTIQIFLDGKAWGAPLPSTNFQFAQPDRGTHTLSAKLMDSNLNVLNETRPITIFVHRVSTLNPAPANRAP